jgi:molecular chaperone DnaK
MANLQVLGIDLGTTYSCVAHLDETGTPRVLLNREGDNTTPSVVYFEDESNVVVGKQAKNELKRNKDRVVQRIKREMGKDEFFIDIDGRKYYPEQISAIILQSVVNDALDTLNVTPPSGGPIADVVITVPAYFGASERGATAKAGKIAGLNVLSIINEPTAAAIAYGLTQSPESRTVLVYDLGGGTFDVTVIEISEEEIVAISTSGDRELGGADFDIRLVDLFVQRFEEQCPDAGDPHDDTDAIGELELEAERAKQSLSKLGKYGMSVTANTARAQFDITRAEFEKLVADLIERTLEYTDIALDAAKEKRKGEDRVDEVILVGGMSKMPLVGQRLAEHLRSRFPNLPDPRLQDPDQIVAKGAALYAASKIHEIYGSQEDQPGAYLPGPAKIIRNISSRGYGVKTARHASDTVGYVTWLVELNDSVPVDKHQTFYTMNANQTEVEVTVYESTTDELTDDVSINKEIVKGDLTGLPPGQPPQQPVHVTVHLGDEGILVVTAKSANGKELSLKYELPEGSMPEEEAKKPLPSISV